MLHPTLENLKVELDALAKQVRESNDARAISIATNQFGGVGICRDELAARAQGLADQISDEGSEHLTDEDHRLLNEYPARLQFLRNSTVPQFWNGANGVTAVPAYLTTLDALERALRVALSMRGREPTEAQKALRQLQNSIRSMQARCSTLQPKVENLDGTVAEILEAHAAAERLPTDLQTLRETQAELKQLTEKAQRHGGDIDFILAEARDVAKELEETAANAKKVVEWSENAMRASTAVGLAGAFHDRAESLRRSILPWVIGLVAALVAGATVGGMQLHQLSEAIQASTTSTIVWTRLAVSLLSVGAPVWFAWLATKQIGQRFKLAEDYAYKASISKAYEGYRREALHLDEDFQKRLFSTALTRLDEQPLRFVDQETHGSPWHELLSSDIVKEALRIAPELAGQISQQARGIVTAAKEKRSAAKKAVKEAATVESE
ncbi:hypothetical protein QCE62_00495 [Caballeronia sp. LZ033]|uniref:hypothetical protein n=1 Tax=Caballeronia sp. LZ033 TaxID=3038566 RepID=UPI00285E56BC|nr:hypothetical protein [Caballeronia sp. LZ033]MDR5812065.1 hypothetical protein [Caballeronia sp. LZ033]